ncbi:isoprene synthase, chloroplastic-like [Rhodamnia argentea]|uniref:Isoprene synthase, chloroplastic-like n=1 Tax=Rhodamnia argentea TaxID=178133 RepID=A0A8B8QB88_9MYRT|nr:isoprene synthase, chloroplastic-like [Rhodamnia argentea]
MALCLWFAPYLLPELSSRRANGRVHCSASTQVTAPREGRRSANYQPSVWTYNYLQSLVAGEGRPSRREVELQKEKEQMLEEEVRGALNDGNAKPLTIFSLVDDIERLGLGYHFEEDISRALRRCLSPGAVHKSLDKSLHGVALSFRILRQHGFEVSQDVFKIFMDESGSFMKTLGGDVQGMLSLYEASHLAFEGEDILQKARTFAIEHLQSLDPHVSKDLQDQVIHELELPLHRRMPLLEARRSIEAYSRRGHTNLLELAATEFNTSQSILQKDLREMLGWWNTVGLAKRLSFARDRLMECFFWAVGIAKEAPLSNCRKAVTKAFALILVLDDVYDVFGTLDELELFTDAVRRWDLDAVEDLPAYMKLCYLVLYNSVNEMAYDTLKETGENVIPYLAKVWYDLCKAFLQEAKWSNNKIVPGVEEYLNNGWVSSSGQVMLTHAYFLSSPGMRKEEVEALEQYHDLLRLPSLIFRLTNDIASSSAELERGETTNSIRCYMQEKGISEVEARKCVTEQIDTAWKKMNKYLVDRSIFNRPFVRMAYNLARMAHCVYQDGDAIGAPDDQSWTRVHSLIIEPVSLSP